MKQETEEIIEGVRSFIERTFDYEIYDITFKSVGRNQVLEVFIDLPKGVTIDDCEKVSKGLGAYLDEVDLIKEEYTLEVSSPGIERILKRQVDYERHVGKLVKWTVRDKTDKRSVFEGRLIEFSPECIKVQTGKRLREFSLGEVTEAQAVFEFPGKEEA